MPLPLIGVALLNLARSALSYLVEKFVAYLVRSAINKAIGKILSNIFKTKERLTEDNFPDIIGKEVEEDAEFLDDLEEDESEEFEFTSDEEETSISEDEFPSPIEPYRILPETEEDLDNLGLEIEIPETSAQLPDFQFTEDE